MAKLGHIVLDIYGQPRLGVVARTYPYIEKGYGGADFMYIVTIFKDGSRVRYEEEMDLVTDIFEEEVSV